MNAFKMRFKIGHTWSTLSLVEMKCFFFSSSVTKSAIFQYNTAKRLSAALVGHSIWHSIIKVRLLDSTIKFYLFMFMEFQNLQIFIGLQFKVFNQRLLNLFDCSTNPNCRTSVIHLQSFESNYANRFDYPDFGSIGKVGTKTNEFH